MRPSDDHCAAARTLDSVRQALRQWGDDLTPLQVVALRRAVGLEGKQVPLCERCGSEDAVPGEELCAYCVHYNDGRVTL